MSEELHYFFSPLRCEAASPHIHPVGWCKEHKRTLITPPGLYHATYLKDVSNSQLHNYILH